MEPYLSQFDVEKFEIASVMGTCAGLVGPKSENVEKVLVFEAFSKGSGLRTPRKRTTERQMGFWVYIGMTFEHFGVTLVRL